MEPILLGGGVDLNSPAGAAKPGTLADCLNYEVTTRGGYTRIAGVEPFDGGPGIGQYKIAQLGYTSASGAFAEGDAVTFDTRAGYVIALGADGATTYATCVFEGGTYTLPSAGTLDCPDTGASATVGVVNVVFQPDGEQQVLDAALAELADARRPEVLPVPGREGADVIAGFFFRNAAYAVRDLPVVYFEGGYYTDANEGQAIDIDGTSHVILDAQVTGHESGFVIYDPREDTSGAPAATPIGSPTLTSLPVSGTLDGGYTMIPYSDGLVASGGLPPYTWEVVGEGESAEPPEDGGDLSEIDFYVEQTPAALWRALDAGGWEMVGQSREIAFTGGTTALRNFPRSYAVDADDITTSAATYPTASELNGVATTDANADDGTALALGTTSGQALVCKGFDFSSLPDGAQVLGVTVEIERAAGAVDNTIDAAVSLVGLPGRAQNKSGAAWPAALAVATYGGAADTWGVEGLLTDQLKDANFGVLLVAKRVSEGTPMNAPVVDFVRVTVTYAQRAGVPIYFWNGTSDVPATMLHAQPVSGDATISTLAGHIALSADANALKTRLVGIGEQIRTAPSGGGDLLAVTASRDRPVFLPGQVDIDHNRSRYLFQQANFFGQDKYDCVYGVSGAGPAFAFDGETIIKIRSPLQPHNDIPRHIARHGDSLALGYFGGALLLSAIGNPFETRGDQGATALEMGDRIVGLAAMPGDALGIICQSQTVLLRGLSQLSFYKSTVSARRGGLEYTLADMGRIIVADSFGLFAADTPESFAAAERNYLSVAVEPWLQERLQATRNTEQRYLRPIVALPVRAKNQYRLYFRDGYVLTMTVRDTMEFTMQRYFVPAAGEFGRDVPWPVRAVAAGIDASGRERLFCSFAGVRAGYLFEIDSGNTLDGESITYRAELNPISFGGMSKLVRLERSFVSATGFGYAPISVARKIDMRPFEPSDYANTEPMLLGRRDRRASIKPIPLRGKFDFPVEGYEFSLLFSGQSGNEGPHTLQMLWVDATNRGTSRGDRGD